ncbi:hypothetical protein JVT61DRAFT_11858 [Boletus reticuloceps]|uniref:Protein kinase domain-containing protein n=1 Tax=Boletus reticuloceps TaxID=495285 RepID=A0A8I2YYN4_9AGAM|nr:hypothetical protein JVT61DRAFT_11858 [Boletus reticuloceps]
MKRGFLTTDKAKRKLTADTDVRKDNDLKGKGKGKAKAEETPADNIKPYPSLLDLHSVPPSIKSLMNYPKAKNRFTFRHWPRDPNGKPIVPSDIHGKEAGNGLNLWGATLYDFYFVRRIPSSVHGLTISTGSKLTKVMEAFGELEHAQNEIAWAAREADPKEVPAWDPAQAIVAHERHVHAGSGDIYSMKKKRTVPSDKSVVAPVEMKREPASKDRTNKPSGKPADTMGKVMPRLPSEIAVESPFHPSHYPYPWPLVPFEGTCSPFPLQRGIPIHLLPKKLYVHDPWKLVHVNSRTLSLDPSWVEFWISKDDHIHTYTLCLPPESQKMAEDAEKAAVAAEEEALKIPETVFISPQETEGPTEQPAIRAFLPKRPRKPTQVPEAHLFLSPKGRLGEGNHSIVYEAELELPRDLFCESTYCKSCLDEQIEVEVDRLKESGEWEERLNKAAKAYQGPREHDAVSADIPTSSSVQLPPRNVGFVKVRLEHVPTETVDMVAVTAPGETPPADAPSELFARVSDSVVNRYVEYQGPVTPIHPNIQWQSPSLPDTLCKHQAETMKPVPRTARFRVAAKLSLPGDPHLEHEASNYLKFPAHFFQHWTGYNVIPPLHDPTPVGALVPQFFGHYTPDSDGKRSNTYRSPILLIEHCGTPISADKLSIDERHECAALLFRFHTEGWLHASFAERNILMQKQHPTCSPLEEKEECDFPHRHRRYSFRLIDFGRSVEYEDTSNMRAREEHFGKELFGIL